MCEGTMDAGVGNWNFGETNATIKVMSFPREVCGYLSRTMLDLILHDFQQRGFIHTE